MTPDLLLAAFCIGVFCLLLLGRKLSPAWALPVILIKISLPVGYFAWFNDGRWNFLDDVTYWLHGQYLNAAGYDPFTILFRTDGLALLVFLSLGPHFLFSWWNQLAQHLFGPYYHSAVLMNVGISVLSGVLLFQISRVLGFSAQYSRGLLVFFLLHWEFLVWSSFINLKDILVGTFTLGALYCFVRASTAMGAKRNAYLWWAGLVVIMFVLPAIRFYVPLLLVGTYGLWVLLRWRGWRKYLVLTAAVAALVLMLPRSIPPGLLVFHPVTVLPNMVRVVLTPQPWSVDAAYSYLLLPSILHWLMLGPALLGAYLLWRRSALGSLLVMYLLAITLFYSVLPDLVTPRNRVQVLFLWAWIQFHAVHQLLAVLSTRWSTWRLMSPDIARRAEPAVEHR